MVRDLIAPWERPRLCWNGNRGGNALVKPGPLRSIQEEAMARLTDAIRRRFVLWMTDEPFPEPPAPGKDPAADREVTEDVDENPLDDEPLVGRVLTLVGAPIDSQAYIECDDETGM